jgi:transposase-like protein
MANALESITFSARWAWTQRAKKHILGIESGATENAASVKRLLTHLRDQGLATDRKYLFVIDGAKALRAAMFGSDHPVQRCRNHKLRNVVDELPKEQQGQALNLMRAAWKVRRPRRERSGWSNWHDFWSGITGAPRAACGRA